MVIVATTEQPPEITPEAIAKAEAMRALMNSDLDEFVIADQVRAFDLGDFDTQMGAWECLTKPERRAWRTFMGMRRPS